MVKNREWWKGDILFNRAGQGHPLSGIDSCVSPGGSKGERQRDIGENNILSQSSLLCKAQEARSAWCSSRACGPGWLELRWGGGAQT